MLKLTIGSNLHVLSHKTNLKVIDFYFLLISVSSFGSFVIDNLRFFATACSSTVGEIGYRQSDNATV